MFNKEESAALRQEFWTSFGKSFPRKWLLYNTKIKGVSFKFVANRKNAMICLDIEHSDEIANEILYDQILSLKIILIENAEYTFHIYICSNFAYVLLVGKPLPAL